MNNGNDVGGLRVARPRLVGARRSTPGRFNVGDECIAEFSPGLLRFLSLGDDAGRALGAGAALPWSIPVGAAGTAAYGVLEPPGFADVNCWTGITNSIHWSRAAASGETLLARCRLAELRRTSARLPYRVVGAAQHDLVVTGEFVFVSVAQDRPRPYRIEPAGAVAPIAAGEYPESARNASIERGVELSPVETAASYGVETSGCSSSELDSLWTRDAPSHFEAAEPIAPDLFALRPPRIEVRGGESTGQVWRWLFPNDLFRLLAHPIAGHSEPLGRRFHPYGRILEGMAVHATLAMAGLGEPREASVHWRAPVRGNGDFHLKSTIELCTAAELTVSHVVCEADREVGVVRVRVAR